jgi:hypothetical protein
MQVIKRYMPDGSTRAVWDDSQAARERRHGAIPSRASRIEVITAGPNRGRFHVDFSLLADLTGVASHQICLLETFEAYTEANRREVAWLHTNYILGGVTARGNEDYRTC